MLMEILERRRLLTVTVNETSPGFYEINGDDSDNTIVISVSQNDQSFTLDGVTYTGVNYIYVFGNGGNDTIDVSAPSAGSIGASIDGGDGNDQLCLNFDGVVWGGAGDDIVILTDSFRGQVSGDEGNDQIYGDGGSNHIYGLGGNDTIYCRNGAADDVDGGSGANFMYGDYVEGQVTNICHVFCG